MITDHSQGIEKCESESDPERVPSQTPFKSIANHQYVHVDAFHILSADALRRLAAAERLTQTERGHRFNVARFDSSSDRISLLHYPAFFEDAFPALRESWQVDLASSRVGHRTYQNSFNPPVLHRKELMLANDHPRRREFEALTKMAEDMGLFRDPTRIGFREQWIGLVREMGYRIVNHEFVPIANDDIGTGLHESPSDDGSIARHRTALVRYGFSAPIQALARYGLIHSSVEVFDYGCGRGDDIRGLTANGIAAHGWDPHYAPAEVKRQADVVNLGFVINVIEDLEERATALRGAYSLTKGVLAVAAMLRSQDVPAGRPFRDGFLTTRNTFQKYFSQAELGRFISDVLTEQPTPVSPGLFFIFRDKDLEQRFRGGRQRSTNLLQRLARPEPVLVRVPRPDRNQLKYEAVREPLDALWNSWMNLGREPDENETEHVDALIGAFGSLARARRFLLGIKDRALVERAREARLADLAVYFALAQFARREPYKLLEAGVQRDIRSFFGDYKTAQLYARQLLFKISDVNEISAACATAAERGLGWLEEGHSLQLHTSLVERLSPVLRIYVACGSLVYGDIQTADLVKIHIASGKLTLMKFDNFEGCPLPRMVQRVKLNLRSQDIEIFDYGEHFHPPYLYFKSRYINEEFPCYAEQLAFDDKLAELDHLLDFAGYGPSPNEFDDVMERNRWSVEGFDLVRSKKVPHLDSACGHYLTYRQLIECGATQQATGLPNLPKEPESYVALYELAVNVLDPVIEYFGAIKLTYGFCSPELAREIKGRIAPQLDQHAAHEKNRRGKYVCSRLGAAVDFLVEDEDMGEVVNWMAENVSFDRLYSYGADRPIHVSYSATPKGEIVDLVQTTNSQRLVPRVRSGRGE
jgi:DNA phosphorothioation-associated putative methyltransferase